MSAPHGVLAGLLLGIAAGAQVHIVGDGANVFDTAVEALPAIKVVAAFDGTCVLRGDGIPFFQGRLAAYGSGAGLHPLPPPPMGLRYLDVEIGRDASIGLLSDGSLLIAGSAYGGAPQLIPPIPNTRYTSIAAGLYCVAIRSDGAILTFGAPWPIPTVPPGAIPLRVVASTSNFCCLLSNGAVLCWGANLYGECNVPSLPAGVVFTSVDAGHTHTVALRSDGLIEAFGDNSLGQCSVPGLAMGSRYMRVRAGTFSGVAWRSDGSLVSWGFCLAASPPPIPNSASSVALGSTHAAYISSGGRLQFLGDNAAFQGALSHAGQKYPVLDVATGPRHVLALDSRGIIVGFGDHACGLIDSSVVPPDYGHRGVYTSSSHALALRADGGATSWGDNGFGQCNVPLLPSGVIYTAAALSDSHSVALRSDGTVVAFGDNANGQCILPPLALGVTATAVAATNGLSVLALSDGRIVFAGQPGSLV